MFKYIANHFGGKKPFINHLGCQINYLSGKYNELCHIDWNRVSRLVFVCHGNICRSAYAEHKAKILGLSSISFGLHAKHGDPANDMALMIAQKREVSLTEHRAQPIENYNSKEGDLLIGFENWHAEKLKDKCDNDSQLTLLGLWYRIPTPYLHDPYHTNEYYFENCFNRIDNAISRIKSLLDKRI